MKCDDTFSRHGLSMWHIKVLEVFPLHRLFTCWSVMKNGNMHIIILFALLRDTGKAVTTVSYTASIDVFSTHVAGSSVLVVRCFSAKSLSSILKSKWVIVMIRQRKSTSRISHNHIDMLHACLGSLLIHQIAKVFVCSSNRRVSTIR